MTDRPIIFSGQMARALIEGRKTMTRRLALPFWQRVQPGDRLWVRENIKLVSQGPDKQVGFIYAADVDPDVQYHSPAAHKISFIGITPSIFMPRWASRLTLIVTATKIERLQKITSADARAEGVGCQLFPRSSVELFRGLWCGLHGFKSWDANPEVVALTFTVRKKNIDAMKVAA